MPEECDGTSGFTCYRARLLPTKLTAPTTSDPMIAPMKSETWTPTEHARVDHDGEDTKRKQIERYGK